MIEVRVERHFSQPVQDVWAHYTDHASWRNWAGLGTARVIRQGVPAPNGVGAVRQLGAAGVTVEEEVIEFEAPKKMTYRLIRGGFPLQNHLGEVQFQPHGDGCTILWTVRCDSALPGTEWLVRAFLRLIFNRALAGLATHLEKSGRA